MITQTFRGKSSDEALKAVRRQFGEHAVILSTRRGKNSEGCIETVIEAAQPQARTGLPRYREESKILADFDRLLEMSGLNSANREWLLEQYRALNKNQAKTINLTTLSGAVGSKLRFESPAGIAPGTHILLGPTGVGKTTTIAKLCGQLLLQGKTSIGLITVDTYRVGGAEQLEGFAKLFKVPMAAAATPSEFKQALYKLRGKDYVLIDTAGCGAKEHAKLQELRELLAETEEIQRTLLLPASGNTQDLQKIVKAFSAIGLSSIGVTKTDETCYFGPCVNVLLQIGLPVALLGTGQEIPHDLVPATAEQIISLLIKATHQ